MVVNQVERLAEDVALWSMGEIMTADIVEHACDALVGGLDSQALRELAGASPTTFSVDIEKLLRQLAEDFGFPFYERRGEAGRLAVARVLARRCVAGELPPREFVQWLHSRVGHGHEDEQVEALVSLDDSYDITKYTAVGAEEIDQQVMDGAHRLLQ